jgi:hypothetical protein
MANNENLGFEHRFAFGASPHTFDSSSTRFEVVSSSVKKQGEVLDGQGLLGTRSKREDRTRAGLVRIGGQIALDINPLMLDFFLPYILGANESTDTFAVADSLPGFDMLEDPFGTGSNAFKYNELYVNRFTLRFAPGILRATLDVIGKTVTTGQSFTSAALGSTATTCAPYVFHDTASGITIRSGSGAQEIEEGELVIDNALDVKFRNSQTASSIRAAERTVSAYFSIPLTSTTLSTYFGDKAAADATIVITNGTVATTFTLNNFKIPDDGIEVGGKGEVALQLRGMARGDGTDSFDVQTTVVGGSL